MRTLAGPGASVAFTNLSSATSASLSAAFTTDTNANPPTGTTSDSASPVAAAQVECHEQGVLALMQSRNIPHERICLLDPKASLALSPSDGDTGKFTWFLFGVRASLSPSHILIPFLSLAGLIRVSSVCTTWYYVHTRASKQKPGGRGCV
jgi:Protein arginine N-methyltransferase SFM1-like